MPCVAAIAAIYREVGTRWTVFAAAWTTVLGYSVATVVYQISTFSSHPLYSLSCIAVSLCALTAMVWWMRKMAYAEEKTAKGNVKRVIPIIPVQ